MLHGRYIVEMMPWYEIRVENIIKVFVSLEFHWYVDLKKSPPKFLAIIVNKVENNNDTKKGEDKKCRPYFYLQKWYYMFFGKNRPLTR